MKSVFRSLIATAMLALASVSFAATSAPPAPTTAPAATPAPTAPPASNPPTPVTPTAPTPAAPAPASGSGAPLRIRNNTARAIHLGGVMLIPGQVGEVPNDKDGVNKRDAESVEGLEILSAAAAKKAGLSERGEANMLEVGDVLHPDNSNVAAATAPESGPTLYKPPQEIVKDAKASGWVTPKQ